MLRAISSLVLFAALSLAGYYATRSTSNPGLKVEFADTSHLATGETVLTYGIENHGEKEVQLIGFGQGCGYNVCVSSADLAFPIKIPARTRYELVLPCLVKEPGQYQLKTAIYYDNGRVTKSIPLVLIGYSSAETLELP